METKHSLPPPQPIKSQAHIESASFKRTLIVVHGEIKEWASASAVRNLIRAYATTLRTRLIALDMGDVTSIDWKGGVAIATANVEVRLAGSRLTVTNPPPKTHLFDFMMRLSGIRVMKEGKH